MEIQLLFTVLPARTGEKLRQAFARIIIEHTENLNHVENKAGHRRLIRNSL